MKSISTAAVSAAVFTGWLWFLVGAPVCAVLLFLARAIKRRSPEAAELHAQYAALERYLKDFGRLQEKPPDAVVLWEHFLVYAVVFGIADEVVEAMRVRAPEVVNDPAFAPSYLLWFAAPGEAGGVSAFSALHEDFGAAVSVATSSSSSGSGGGGGFSGGGGGGGGGRIRRRLKTARGRRTTHAPTLSQRACGPPKRECSVRPSVRALAVDWCDEGLE